MKKIIPVIIAALFLSGCAAFAQFRNPIGPNQLAQAESAYGLVLTAAVAYRQACNDKVIPRSKCAPIIIKLQSADKMVRPALIEARKFVKDNPTLDATDLIQIVRSGITIFQQIATANGVK